MSVILYTHPSGAAHDTGPGHPERPARLDWLIRALDTPEFTALERRAAPPAPRAALLAVHTERLVDDVLGRTPPVGRLDYIDGDTVVSAGSVEAARHAAGAAIAAVDAVLAGDAAAAFCALRPPGHHAERDRAMGFCLFNSAAIAAAHARAAHGLRRIAVVDFDVHHGNGTQDIFWADPNLFYASSHQHPCYPGTGMAGERGVAGNIVNAPLPPGTGGQGFLQAWDGKLIPALENFGPELLIVSAGFDAHEADPLAQLEVREADFYALTKSLLAVADRHCPGRVVSILEGGYDLAALAASAAAHVKALMRL